MARHIKSGDMVIVNSGTSAWKKNPDGSKSRDYTPRKVLKVITETDRVIVEGANVRRKRLRPTQANPQGGYIEQEMPIHISNVQPAVSVDGESRPTRVRFVTKDDGSKVRVAARNGEELSVLKKAKS